MFLVHPVVHNLVLIKLTGFLVHPVGPVEYNLVIMLIIPGWGNCDNCGDRWGNIWRGFYQRFFLKFVENNIRRLSFKHAYCEGLLNWVQSLIQWEVGELGTLAGLLLKRLLKRSCYEYNQTVLGCFSLDPTSALRSWGLEPGSNFWITSEVKCFSLSLRSELSFLLQNVRFKLLLI